jgi:hypothetical protein
MWEPQSSPPVAVSSQPLVVLVQSASAQIATSRTITGSFTTPPVRGRLLVAVVGNSGFQASAGQPAGWSVAIREPGNNPGQSIYYKVAGASEPSTVTFSGFASADNLGLQLFEFSGVDAMNAPVTGTVFGSTTANTPDPRVAHGQHAVLLQALRAQRPRAR